MGKIPMTIPKTIRNFLIVLGIAIGILHIPVHPYVSLHGNIIFPLRFVALIYTSGYVLFFAVLDSEACSSKPDGDVTPTCRHLSQ